MDKITVKTVVVTFQASVESGDPDLDWVMNASLNVLELTGVVGTSEIRGNSVVITVDDETTAEEIELVRQNMDSILKIVKGAGKASFRMENIDVSDIEIVEDTILDDPPLIFDDTSVLDQLANSDEADESDPDDDENGYDEDEDCDEDWDEDWMEEEDEW